MGRYPICAMGPAAWGPALWVVLLAVALGDHEVEDVLTLAEFSEELLHTSELIQLSNVTAADGNRYAKVPDMLITHGGSKVQAASREGCEGACDSKESCQGFSWSNKRMACVLTTRKMVYDFHYISFISGSTGFYKIDGLVLENVIRRYKSGKTLQFCESACAMIEECKGFSYSHELQSCLLSAEDYDSYSNAEFAFF